MCIKMLVPEAFKKGNFIYYHRKHYHQYQYHKITLTTNVNDLPVIWRSNRRTPSFNFLLNAHDDNSTYSSFKSFEIGCEDRVSDTTHSLDTLHHFCVVCHLRYPFWRYKAVVVQENPNIQWSKFIKTSQIEILYSYNQHFQGRVQTKSWFQLWKVNYQAVFCQGD